jgi:hypothetical protein
VTGHDKPSVCPYASVVLFDHIVAKMGKPVADPSMQSGSLDAAFNDLCATDGGPAPF